jgi:hypothetical protein
VAATPKTPIIAKGSAGAIARIAARTLSRSPEASDRDRTTRSKFGAGKDDNSRYSSCCLVFQAKICSIPNHADNRTRLAAVTFDASPQRLAGSSEELFAAAWLIKTASRLTASSAVKYWPAINGSPTARK